MGAFANLQLQGDFTSFTNQVCTVVNVLERRHKLTLLCRRIMLILAPCVCSCLATSTILRIHRVRIQSLQRRELRGRPAATGWGPELHWDCSLCSLLGGYNTGRECKCFELRSSLLTWMPLVGREPKFNHVGEALRVWRRSGIGCASTTRKCT